MSFFVVRWHKQTSLQLRIVQRVLNRLYISRQLFRRSYFLVLLSLRLRAENVRSEVADVTGIVKNIGKSVFRHQNVGGGLCPLIFVFG